MALTLDVLVIAAQVAAIGGFMYWMSQIEKSVGDGNIALGNLDSLLRFQSLRTSVYYEIMLAAGILTVITGPVRQTAAAARPSIAVGRALTLLLLAILIPQAYGVVSMPLGFRSVRAIDGEGTRHCGLLVGAAQDNLNIWRAVKRVGSVVTVRRESMRTTEIGGAYLLADLVSVDDPCGLVEGRK